MITQMVWILQQTGVIFWVEVVPPSVCVADKAKNFNYSKSNSTSIISSVALSATSSATMTSAFGACDGMATVVASNGNPAYTYLWDGEAGFQTSATAVGLCAGSYTVTVTDALGANVTSTAIVNQPVGIEKTMLEESFRIAPNPTSGKSYIEFSSMPEELTLEIYDLLGRNVYSTIVRTKRSILDLSHQPKGVYHLKISSQSSWFIRKIVIE